MATGAAQIIADRSIGDLLSSLVRAEGSAGQGYCASETLRRGPQASRNLADAIHQLCALHGRHPGVVDFALERAATGSADWLLAAAAAFAEERAYLTRLVVAAGPLPSTPGQAETEAAVIGQRHAIEMLARSDRNGCALGAAAALIADWAAVREVLDLAADRFGVEREPSMLPDEAVVRAALAETAGSPAIERAISFGAQQILVQHRGLWSLLEARAAARAAS